MLVKKNLAEPKRTFHYLISLSFTVNEKGLEEKLVNLVSLLKSRDTSLLTKVRIVRAVVFPVVMYTCESWTIKKAEH